MNNLVFSKLDIKDDSRALLASIEAHLGPVASIDVLGFGDTYLIESESGLYVLKYGREDLFYQLNTLFGFCKKAGLGAPTLVDWPDGRVRQLLLMTYIPGEPLNQQKNWWPDYKHQIRRLLEHLQELPVRPSFPALVPRWESDLNRNLPEKYQPLLQKIMIGLDLEPTVAHGYFAPQNIIDNGRTLALINWHHFGNSFPAFDAGWLLAINRVYGQVSENHGQMQSDLSALFRDPFQPYFGEGLSLLCLLYLARKKNPRPLPQTYVSNKIISGLHGWMKQAAYLWPDIP
ncbi:MAG: hypothetical protein QNJ45_04705 [Ardenticatenaceae bacterium]|nr:hypothetical protein [Ardenticatenaceae bacterium]